MPMLEKVQVPCPKCGAKTEVRLEDIHEGSSFTCRSCGERVGFTGDDGRKARKALDELEATLRQLQATAKKFGK